MDTIPLMQPKNNENLIVSIDASCRTLACTDLPFKTENNSAIPPFKPYAARNTFKIRLIVSV